jgi:NAD-dependent dihydropyrimidine dehydrogenase PreA subunit
VGGAGTADSAYKLALAAKSRIFVVEKGLVAVILWHRRMQKIHFSQKQTAAGGSRPRGPLGIKARAVVKRFLGSYAGCGQACVEICAANGFYFGHSLGKKYGKASDESVAGTGAVNAVD